MFLINTEIEVKREGKVTRKRQNDDKEKYYNPHNSEKEKKTSFLQWVRTGFLGV